MSPEARAYRRSVTVSAAVCGAVALIGAVVGSLVAGVDGLVAALIGAAVAAVGAVSTPAVMLVAHRKAPHVMAAAVAGTALGTLVVFVAAVAVLRGVESFQRGVFAATAAAALLGSLVGVVLVLRKARIPYVDPGSN